MKKREFYVIGLKPAAGKQMNDFIRMFDLGTEGAFIPLAGKVTILVKDDVTDDQWERQPGAIKLAYEEVGCVEVKVVEATAEYQNVT